MASKTDELMAMIESLPVDLKMAILEKIPASLHPSQKEIDALWIEEVEARISDLDSGRVKPVPGLLEGPEIDAFRRRL